MIEKIKDICVIAGKCTLKYYDKNCETRLKSDDSPVTIADIESNEIIVTELEKNFPKIPVLTEESDVPNYDIRKSWDTYFLIDPLDGTRQFIENRSEYTINIALVQSGVSVLGVVYCPVLDLLWWAEQGKGAYLLNREQVKVKLPIIKNKPIKLTCVASRSIFNEDTKIFVKKLESVLGELIVKNYGSSLKICKIAEGSADVYPRIAPTSEWDTAAAQCVLEEAGGRMININTCKSVTYNKENLKNPYFLCIGININESLYHEILKMINS
jgi:3'(2'), 5'-bisphosphate nucleotidase